MAPSSGLVVDIVKTLFAATTTIDPSDISETSPSIVIQTDDPLFTNATGFFARPPVQPSRPSTK